MKPRTGYLFKRWRGKHIRAKSDVDAPYYFAYQVNNERRTVALHTKDHEEAQRRMGEFMGKARHTSTRDEWLRSLIDMGKWAERELRGAHLAADPVYVESAWARYLASRRRPNSGEGTLKMYNAHWKALQRWLPPHVKRLGEVTPGLAEQYVRYLETPRTIEVGPGKKKRTVTRSMTAATVDKNLSFLRLFWRVLTPDEQSPWSGLHSAMDHEPTTHRALDVAEVRNLLSVAEGEWKTLILTGYTTGLRLKDCCLLDWSAVDLAEKVIHLAPAKTRRKAPGRLAIPILPELMSTLVLTDPGQRAGPVLPGIAALYNRDRATVVKRIKKIFVQANVHDSGDGTSGFHSLRTTWQTLNDIAGTSRVIARSVLGHKSASMSDTYSRMDAGAARKAVEKAIPRVLPAE